MAKKSKYIGIRGMPEFEKNPFVEKAIDDIRRVKKQQIIRSTDGAEVHTVVDMTSGDVVAHQAFYRQVEVDEKKFAKLYLSEFESFWGLSKPAIRVFGYILSMIKPNDDKFYFDMEECKSHTKYGSSKSVLDGLSNLIECQIIAKSTKHYLYFINPMIVFNGSRITFARTYVKRKEKDNENQIGLFDDQSRIKQIEKVSSNRKGE